MYTLNVFDDIGGFFSDILATLASIGDFFGTVLTSVISFLNLLLSSITTIFPLLNEGLTGINALAAYIPSFLSVFFMIFITGIIVHLLLRVF